MIRRKGKYINLQKKGQVLYVKTLQGVKNSRKRKNFIKHKGKCNKCPNTKTLTAHHIIPLSEGGKDIKRNYECLCEKCHDKETKRWYDKKNIK